MRRFSSFSLIDRLLVSLGVLAIDFDVDVMSVVRFQRSFVLGNHSLHVGDHLGPTYENAGLGLIAPLILRHAIHRVTSSFRAGFESAPSSSGGESNFTFSCNKVGFETELFMTRLVYLDPVLDAVDDGYPAVLVPGGGRLDRKVVDDPLWP